jgi:hypothetical protein
MIRYSSRSQIENKALTPDILCGSENKGITSGFIFNRVEFDTVKLLVIDNFPNTQELNSRTGFHPILNNETGVIAIFIFGDIGDADEIFPVNRPYRHITAHDFDFCCFAHLRSPVLIQPNHCIFATIEARNHTFTSTMVMVSLPKMSTTLTAILRRPGVHSSNRLLSSRDRSFLVRKICRALRRRAQRVGLTVGFRRLAERSEATAAATHG